MPDNQPEPNFFNEEALRAHVMLPWLSALGIEPASVVLEKGFTIRLGHGVHKLDAKQVGGRADILVRNAQKEPLFIVELKAPHLALTEDDRDQGISYARLLDRIAPYVLVTNGKDTRIYDTVTREALNEQTIGTTTSLRALSVATELQLRFEALESFIGYSPEHVQIFSSLQITKGIRPLLGSKEKPGKFVQDLYVPRSRVREAISQFLTGSDLVFALVGDSGVGKTNEMCALAQSYAPSHVVLFYSCYSIVHSPEATLAADFNWNFSQQLEAPQLMRNLASIAQRSGKPMLIFLDALDEAPFAQFPEACNEFVRHIAKLDGRVRVVVSAKSTEWGRFSTVRGDPSELHLALGSEGDFQSDRATAWKPGHPVVLDEFAEDELSLAIEKYRHEFKFTGEPAKALRALCRVPFFLRVTGEAYAHSDTGFDSDQRASDLARRWLDRKLHTMRDAEHARDAVRSLAGCVYERALRGLRENETLGALETVTDAEVSEIDLSELVAHGVVVRTFDEDHRASFRFTHSRILHYVLARHVLRLDELSTEEFGKVLEPLLSSYALQGVLAWHLLDAPIEHSNCLRDLLSGRAMLYVSAYSNIFENFLPALRDRVPPYVPGQIGLGYTVGNYGVESFGFYPVDQAGGRLLTEVPHSAHHHSADIEALFKIGCVDMRTAARNFGSHDPHAEARKFAWERVAGLVTSGGLDERSSPTLMVESVLAICTQPENMQKLGLPKPANGVHGRYSLFPLDLKKLAVRVQEYFGRREYEEAVVRQFGTEKAGTVVEKDGVTYSEIDVQYAALVDAGKRAKNDAERGVRFPTARYIFDRELAYLITLIDDLAQHGIFVVERDVLPHPDRPFAWPASPLDHYSDEGIVELVTAFFTQSLAAYNTLVKSNLSALSPRLGLHARMPLSVVGGWARKQRHLDGMVWWAFLSKNVGEDLTPIIRLNPPEPFFERDATRRGFITQAGERVTGHSVIDIPRLFRPTKPVGFGQHTDRSSASRDAPVRAFAYELLIDDFKTLGPDSLIVPTAVT